MALHPADILLASLSGIADGNSGDVEVDHADADASLIAYVEATAPAPRGQEIVNAWDRIERWYA